MTIQVDVLGTDWVGWISAGANIGLLIATGLLTWFAWFQLRAIAREARAADAARQLQLDQLERQLEIADETRRGSLEPVVVVSAGRDARELLDLPRVTPREIEVCLDVSNIGPGPGIRPSIHVWVEHWQYFKTLGRTDPDWEQLGDAHYRMEALEGLAPGTSIQDAGFIRYRNVQRSDDGQYALIWRSRTNDVFGVEHIRSGHWVSHQVRVRD